MLNTLEELQYPLSSAKVSYTKVRETESTEHGYFTDDTHGVGMIERVACLESRDAATLSSFSSATGCGGNPYIAHLSWSRSTGIMNASRLGTGGQKMNTEIVFPYAIYWRCESCVLSQLI
ncbi:hypothetical protein RhiJN_10407 [Ceratobasidium sp. AG-Ba]|nr:hypothetical protein RhiJN_10407 [Ceratobasidium sp. AG-Ba]QRW11140.1 hypothetical protein RhiLY_10139 [Ceratobasidium sp. AG-Ba]